MPATYSKEAIEACFQLFLLHNGQHHELIENEMRKTWPGWSRQNLYTRGKGRNLKEGWVDKFGFERGLKLHLAQKPESILNDAEELYRQIQKTRRRLYTDLEALGATPNKDLIYQYRDFCKLEIEALTKIETARDSLGGFTVMWERLMAWLPEIDAKAAGALLKVAERVIDRATAEYADQEQRTEYSGIQNRADEVRDGASKIPTRGQRKQKRR